MSRKIASAGSALTAKRGHFRRADELNRRALAAPFVARTQVDHAEMLHTRRRRGDVDRAETLLGAARATAEELGLGGLQPRIRRLAG